MMKYYLIAVDEMGDRLEVHRRLECGEGEWLDDAEIQKRLDLLTDGKMSQAIARFTQAVVAAMDPADEE
jgi:hypothetical protein